MLGFLREPGGHLKGDEDVSIVKPKILGLGKAELSMIIIVRPGHSLLQTHLHRLKCAESFEC